MIFDITYSVLLIKSASHEDRAFSSVFCIGFLSHMVSFVGLFSWVVSFVGLFSYVWVSFHGYMYPALSCLAHEVSLVRWGVEIIVGFDCDFVLTPVAFHSVAVCCSVLQCVAVCRSVLQCIAVCCSVLQCVAVCCSVLQCVAVCCSVLQCVAVCCSVLRCTAVR